MGRCVAQGECSGEECRAVDAGRSSDGWAQGFGNRRREAGRSALTFEVVGSHVLWFAAGLPEVGIGGHGAAGEHRPEDAPALKAHNGGAGAVLQEAEGEGAEEPAHRRRAPDCADVARARGRVLAHEVSRAIPQGAAERHRKALGMWFYANELAGCLNAALSQAARGPLALTCASTARGDLAGTGGDGLGGLPNLNMKFMWRFMSS